MSSSPLRGVRVVVTRSAEQGRPLASAIADAGGEAIVLPLLEIRNPSDGGARLREALRSLHGDDWLAVLSPNGAQRVVGSGIALGQCRLAVVGTATAARFVERGREPDLSPAVATSDGLLDAFAEIRPGRIVIAQASGGLPTLADGLRAFGWDVETVVAYENAVPDLDPLDRARARDGSDVVVFASPTAVTRYCSLVGSTPERAVCIGPVTGSSARAAGFDVRIAEVPDVASILERLVELAQG